MFKFVNFVIITKGDILKNINLFLGDEPLIINNKIDKLVASITCDDLNITTYNLEEVNVSVVIQDALTPPFLSKNKIIIMKKPIFLTNAKIEIKHNTKMFSDYLDKPLDTTFLIIDGTGLHLNDKFDYVMKLKAKADVSDTKELSQVEIEGWLKRQFAVAGVEIKDDAVKVFLENVGRNLINAKNEVDKLLNYIYPKKVISSQTVEEVVTKETDQDAFALSNAIIDKNKEKIIKVYNELIRNGKDATQLIAMVSRSMIDILVTARLLAKGYQQVEIAQAMSISTGRAYYLIKNAKSIKLKVVEENVMKLANLDCKVKSGQIDPNSGLELFIFGL